MQVSNLTAFLSSTGLGAGQSSIVFIAATAVAMFVFMSSRHSIPAGLLLGGLAVLMID